MLELIDKDEQERLERFKKAWEAYTTGGDKPLKVDTGNPDDNVVVPYEQVIVNKGRSFLFKDDVGFELPENTPRRDETQRWLDAVWAKNHKRTKLLKAATNGGVFGHCVIKIVPDKSDGMPRLVILDPATVTIHWDDEDIERVIGYDLKWNTIRDGQPVVRRQRIEPNGIRHILTLDGRLLPYNESLAFDKQVSEGDRLIDAGGWLVVDEVKTLKSGSGVNYQEMGRSIWPYSWPPVIDWQNLPVPNEYWGRSDIEDAVLRFNKVIDRLLSNLNRIIRLHAHPKTYGKGITAEQLAGVNFDPDSVLPLPNPDAELKNLEMQSELGSSIELYTRLKELLHEVTRIPEVASGKLENAGSLSGTALAILYGPIVELTEDKRCTYGDALVDLNRRLLELGGFGPDLVVDLVWPDIVPNDPIAEGQSLLIDKQLGASGDTLLMKRGYDPDEEREAKKRNLDEFGGALLAGFEQGQPADNEDGNDNRSDDSKMS